MCKGSTAKAAHTLVCSWRKYSCRPCTWRLQPSHNHQYLSSLCCQCCHCICQNEKHGYLCSCSSSKSNYIFALTTNWRSLSSQFSKPTYDLLSYTPFSHISYKPLSSPFTSVPFHLPKMTCSHVHQPLTNWTSSSLLSLSPSNALTFITTTNFVTMACRTRITGNNVGIRGEAWCGLSLCSYY